MSPAAGERTAARLRIASGPEEAGFDPDTVITIGTFDGMHRGHRAILADVREKTRVRPGRAVVVTFDPHPRSVLGSAPVALLTTLEERIALFDGAGLDLVIVARFTPEFSRQSAASFYERWFVRGTGVRDVVVGHDHHFGRDREAGIDALRGLGERFGFGVTVVGPVSAPEGRISSSAIRRLLAEEGNAALAAAWLGRPYAIAGTVDRGAGRGAPIGFPTANVAPSDPGKLVPRRGVYFGTLEFDGDRRHAMINVGTRPTFGGGSTVIEAHLPGWSGDLYGRRVDLAFLDRMRDERTFSDAGELAAQLRRDRDDCLARIAAGGHRP